MSSTYRKWPRGEVVAGAKTRDRRGRRLLGVERAHEAVALRALHVVDEADELRLVRHVRAQRVHREIRLARVGRLDLANVH
jgi:hypothetical protein